MDGRGRTFLLLQIFFSFFVFASTEEAKQNCSQVECPGPLMYYEDVGCTPVYKNEGDCCAYKYNCDHLDARSLNKCYIKNKSYEVGEYVDRDVINSCTIRCVCVATSNSTGFSCTLSDYVYRPRIGSNCYLKRNVHDCGPGTPTCLKHEAYIPRCVANGYSYRAGEAFRLLDEPLKICMCQEGYKGDNVEPFCTTMNIRHFPFDYRTEDIVSKNLPVYDQRKEGGTNRIEYWRRQEANDTVIPNPNKSVSPEENQPVENEDLTCKFGNLTMNIGDQLSPSIDYHSPSMNCTCEVPPALTCKLLD